MGDLDKPKLVFFFDEAHLLFDDAPKALVDKVEQVVRLLRSKGVGVYFITQNPLDVPDTILGQLGNRVQHALRAFTPRDQKAVRAAAETFGPNPKLDTAQVIMVLGVGEAEKLAEIYLTPKLSEWRQALFDVSLNLSGIEGWFAYVMALLFLLIRPEGLFGEKHIDRV